MTPELRAALLAADALLRKGDAAIARDRLQQFARADPASAEAPEFDLIFGESCFQCGDPGLARVHAQRALEARPQWFEALHLLGRALADLDLTEEAALHLEHALRLRPHHARVATNLGAVYRRLGRLAEALVAYRKAATVDIRSPIAWRGVAETLQALGNDDEAIAAWTHWASIVPERVEGLSGLGFAYTRARRWDEAERHLAQAVAMPGADHHADMLLGFVRRERGDTQGALAAYRKGAERAPDAITPAVASALLLPPVYASAADVAEWRQRYEAGIADLQSTWPRFRAIPQSVWDLDWTNFYLAYQGGNDRALQVAYADLVGQITSAAAPHWAPNVAPSNLGMQGRAPGDRKIRVGFASAYFRRSTVGAYFQSWITNLDRDRFEVHAFHYGSEVDETTEAIRTAAHGFAHAAERPLRIAERIHRANLDILIYPEIGMDGRDATLSTLRLAPVQCAAWGHPVTTGSRAIDYFISCERMEPADAADHYCERLLLLPGLGTSYRCPEVRPAQRNEFALPDGRRLYACPQSLFKIHPENDAIFCALLEADPQAIIVFCAEPGQPVTVDFRSRIERALEARNIDPGRIAWQPMRREPDFRAMLSVCDVLIDTLHWSGGNTSLDALAAGLPIVTLPGRYLRGRQSAAMLQMIGLPDLVAKDLGTFVATAIAVATDREGYRRQIAATRSRLFDRDEPIRALEACLERIVSPG